MCSMIDSGEKGYKLPEQNLFNSLVLYLTLYLDERCPSSHLQHTMRSGPNTWLDKYYLVYPPVQTLAGPRNS